VLLPGQEKFIRTGFTDSRISEELDADTGEVDRVVNPPAALGHLWVPVDGPDLVGSERPG
jgi:hypothetical protein